MRFIQIDETDGAYFSILAKPMGDGQTLYLHFEEDAGVTLIYTMPSGALQDMPEIEAMAWGELLAAGFVER